ncbi:hypothetical protein KCP69_17790 [Salmonella enterica subsp. enterica]|nr:hypothetical protein KCP69_17790 [Salmonella enterica subsp. enterica]
MVRFAVSRSSTSITCKIRQHHYYTTRSNENDIKIPTRPRAASFTIATAPAGANVPRDIAVTPYKISRYGCALPNSSTILYC